MKNVNVEYVNLEDDSEMGKMENIEKKFDKGQLDEFGKIYDEMIEEHEKEMEKMGRMADKFEEEMLFNKVPRKSITVKLLQSTHKKLKIMAASEDKAINMTVTSIVEHITKNNKKIFSNHFMIRW